MANIALLPAEAAKILQVSEGTIYSLIHRDDDPLPTFRVGATGRGYRVPLLALIQWTNRQAGYNIDIIINEEGKQINA